MTEYNNMEETEQQNTLELEEENMNTNDYEFVVIEEQENGFIKDNKGAIGAAAGVGAAGFIGGFFTGKITEKKKNEKLFKAIQEEIGHFADVMSNKAEGDIMETYAYRNAEDIKNKILSRIRDTKMKDSDKAKWIELLGTLIEMGSAGRTRQIITDKEIVNEVKDTD